MTGKDLMVEGVFTKKGGRKITSREEFLERSNMNVPSLSEIVPKK